MSSRRADTGSSGGYTIRGARAARRDARSREAATARATRSISAGGTPALRNRSMLRASGTWSAAMPSRSSASICSRRSTEAWERMAEDRSGRHFIATRRARVMMVIFPLVRSHGHAALSFADPCFDDAWPWSARRQDAALGRARRHADHRSALAEREPDQQHQYPGLGAAARSEQDP